MAYFVMTIIQEDFQGMLKNSILFLISASLFRNYKKFVFFYRKNHKIHFFYKSLLTLCDGFLIAAYIGGGLLEFIIAWQKELTILEKFDQINNILV